MRKDVVTMHVDLLKAIKENSVCSIYFSLTLLGQILPLDCTTICFHLFGIWLQLFLRVYF